MFQWIKNLLKGHGAEAVREVIVHSLLKEGGKEIAKEAVKKINDHHRAELKAFLMLLSDDVARDNLQIRYRKTLEPPRGVGKSGDENRFVNLLTRLWLVLKDNPKQCEIVFTELGYLTDEEFDEVLYFLENDIIPQWYKKAKAFLGETANDIVDGLKAVDNSEVVKQIDKSLKPIEKKWRDKVKKIEKKGRIAKWFVY